jgi:hypothetical protein
VSTPHKHAAVIKAWADGAAIECKGCGPMSIWKTVTNPEPIWSTDWEYRVKPHKWQEVIDAHAAGKTIQYTNSGKSFGWFDWPVAGKHTDFDIPNLIWRIKPEVVRFRLALLKLPARQIHAVVAIAHGDEPPMCSFVRWLGDWQEVEAA